MTDAATQQDLSITISESAAKRLAELVVTEGNDALMLRVSVSGGGCAGFQYGFDFDDRAAADDRVFERDGARVVVDEMSLALIGDSEIDYVQDMIGSYFSVHNPKATSSCSCGTSFSIG